MIEYLNHSQTDVNTCTVPKPPLIQLTENEAVNKYYISFVIYDADSKNKYYTFFIMTCMPILEHNVYQERSNDCISFEIFLVYGKK